MITANQFYIYEDQLTEDELSVVYNLIDSATSQTQAMKYVTWLFLDGDLEAGFRTKEMDALLLVGRRILQPREVCPLGEDFDPPKGAFFGCHKGDRR